MTKPIIMFDMDDTMCHFMGRALGIINSLLSKNIKPEELTETMWIHNMLNEEELKIVLPKVFSASFYATLDPAYIVYQAQSSMWKELHDAFNFHVVTARKIALGRRSLQVTSDWLHSNLVDVDGITITHPYESKLRCAPRETKVVVEDSKTVARDALAHGCRVFLVDQPWNRDMEPNEALIRVTPQTLLQRMHSVLVEHRF